MTPEEIDRLLTEAEERHRAGDLDGAERGYVGVLDMAPDNADALQLLGGLNLQRGHNEKASELLNRAVSLAPHNPVARLNLAACFQRAGRAGEALPHAKKAAEIAPRAPEAWRQLSIVAERAGRHGEAVEALRRLLELVPQDRAAAVRRATLLLMLRRIDEAEMIIVQLMRTHPPADDISNLLTRLYAGRYDWSGMAAAAEAWLKMSPDSELARERLSEAQFEAGNIPAAVDAYRPLVAGDAPSPERRLAFARVCMNAQEFGEAEAQLRQVLEQLPDSADAAHAWGRLQTFLGNFDEAENACRRAIDLDPDFISAYTQLSNVRRGRMDDEHVAAMNRLWKQAGAPEPTRAVLGMALATVADKAGEVDEAFGLYRAANELSRGHFARQNAAYRPAEQEARTNRLMTLFENSPIPEHTVPVGDYPAPVFIVGMPRSGTTLTESILAAHSKVYGAGEIMTGGKLLELFLQVADASPEAAPAEIIAANREEWRGMFFESLPAAADGERIVTDKMPTNFWALGLLAHLFPEARFVHTQRDALDTGWSIYRHPFSRAYSFAHRLEDIGHYYREYLRFMDFWRPRCAGRLHTVVHEELTAGPEEESRKLIEFCGLDWEPGCLAFHETKRPIATFSSVQVRSPISSSSVGSANRYRQHLGPLMESLGLTDDA